MTRTCHETLCYLNMHPHTKIGIPTSKNIGDMHRTGSGTDGLTDGQTDGEMDKAITICLPEFLWGHKNSFVKKAELMIAANPVCLYSTSLYKA